MAKKVRAADRRNALKAERAAKFNNNQPSKKSTETKIEQVQKNAVICGTVISVLQLILLFGDFERILQDVNFSEDSIPKEYKTISSFFMMIFVKLRPILFGVFTKLILQVFVQKKNSSRKEKQEFIEEKLPKENSKMDFSLLSPREIEIAKLVQKHYKNQQIADELFISTETVKRHLSTIFEKLGIESRKELWEEK